VSSKLYIFKIEKHHPLCYSSMLTHQFYCVVNKRIVIQAEPPLLVVHVNAAFSRLTGMQNNYVIGRPLPKILALADHDQKLISEQMQSSNRSVRDQSIETKKVMSPPSNCSEVQSKNRLDVKEAHKADKTSLISHENAAAVGMRIAETETRDISIERLLASTSDFRNCYRVHTLEFKGSQMSSDRSNNGSNNGSNNSSISSKDLPFNPTICVMSVCPIPKCNNQSVSKHTTSTASSKRRKHSHPHTHRQNANSPSRRSNAKCTTPSHYVIQLFLIDDGGGNGDVNINEKFEGFTEVPSNVGINLSSSPKSNATGELFPSADSEQASLSSQKALSTCG